MMRTKRFGFWNPPKRGKAFQAWQVELTTSCPLRCRMCVREGEAPWQYHQMPLPDFRKLLPHLPQAERVVLEGWGESLLHPDLAEIIRLVKEAGPRVGFVTSGCGLTQERARELVRAGVDFMGFSLAGATESTHDGIRRNSHLPDLLEAIRLVQEEKRRQQRERPDLHLVFLLLKDNIQEVPLLPALAREVGIETVILINPTHISTSRQEAQRPYALEGEEGRFGPLLVEAQKAARQHRIRLQETALTASHPVLCTENPLENLYISAEGEVSPCVYAHPPLASPFRRIFRGREVTVEKVSFGNLFRSPFPEIWESDAYRDFRERFRQRGQAYRAFYNTLFDGQAKDPRQGLALPEPPEHCRSCHKILGF